MRLADMSVEVLNPDLSREGLIQDQDLDISLRLLHQGGGSWTVTLPVDNRLAGSILAPGAGILVTVPGGYLMSGFTTTYKYEASADSPFGNVVVNGLSDEAMLGDRVCLPDPYDLTGPTQTVAHDSFTGTGEDAMIYYVNRNLGPGAHVNRRESSISIAPSLHRGGNVTINARFDMLNAQCAEIANIAGLGFRVLRSPSGGTRVFSVYQPVDRSRFVRLGVWNDSVQSESVQITAPSATDIIIAGAGEQEDRSIYFGTSVTSVLERDKWHRRIEKFIDMRQTDDTSQYTQRTNQELGDNGVTKAQVQVVPLEDEASGNMRFGVDYNLGDLVTASTQFGEFLVPVAGIALKANSDGFRVGLLLGDLSSSSTTDINDLIRRITSLEKAQ